MLARLSLIVLVGCTAAVADPPTPSPPPVPKMPEPSYPVGAIAPRCLARADIAASISGGSLRLKLSLVNTTGKPLKVTLTGSCPQGVAGIGGLPAGFDPMHTCQRGACTSPTETRTIDLPAGRTPVSIGETTLASKGDRCNPALPLGSTFLQATVTSSVPFDACSGGQVHVVRAKNGALRLAKLDEPAVPATPPPPPPKVAPKPAPKPAPKRPTKPCPACAFACLNGGVPSSRRDANGCPVCACENPGF